MEIKAPSQGRRLRPLYKAPLKKRREEKRRERREEKEKRREEKRREREEKRREEKRREEKRREEKRREEKRREEKIKFQLVISGLYGALTYEMLYGMPYSQEIPGTSIMIEDISIQNYIQTIGQHVTKLKEKGMLAQTGPLGFKIHMIQPGDGVFIKSWKEETLTPKWEGPYLTLLTTDTSVRTAKKGWTHTSKVKEPMEPPMVAVENHLTAQGSTNNLGKEGQENVEETS
ncbi:hypothetical protein DUI87_30684 [Hirundo rustica rustica]|uniref:Murine leukemia virus integrase C-terminal domain-containing protein n=1 Tax=Hirundo rustica rustica TaxID=333673 RepID=A0A3M0IWA0_HIRRU|nr:hypothetical protein DUI87_30684 [Hirundo rustica rustica]